MKTPLYDRHLALGAKMVDFCGWEMPLHYQSIVQEHLAVRSHVGIFDVSHMGRILVHGPDAESFLDYLSTNLITGKKDYSAIYTVWSTPEGGCVDDVIIYKQDKYHFFVIVNACNRHKDLQHLQDESESFDVYIEDRFAEDGILAIQGPEADNVIKTIFPAACDLEQMHFMPLKYDQEDIILSRTGYTGSGGFEIYAQGRNIVNLWDSLLKNGAPFGIVPVGLGARDTLRLEMGYALYGHEINDKIAANESVASWTIKWDKPNFLGKAALETLERSNNKRHEHGAILLDPGVARSECLVFKNGKEIGIVTSGSYSPILNKSIAIVLLSETVKNDDIIDIQIRQKMCKAKIVKLPFPRKL